MIFNNVTIRKWNSIWRSISGLDETPSPFQLAITEPLTLYVSVSGNDKNPGTEDAPFRTLQSAYDSLNGVPRSAPVTIRVGSGAFAGVRLAPLDGTRQGGYVQLVGTLGLYVPSSGPNQGAVSSLSAGNCVYTTFVISGANWVVDELKGKFVQNDTTGTITCVPIVSNSADTLTVFTFNATYSNGDLISIVEPKSVIDSQHSDNGPFLNSNSTSGTSSISTEPTALVKVDGLRNAVGAPAVSMTGFRFTSTTVARVRVYSSSVLFRNCIFDGTGTANHLVSSNSEVALVGVCSLAGSTIRTNGSTAAIASGQNCLSLALVFFDGVGTETGVFGFSKISASDLAFKGMLKALVPQDTQASFSRTSIDTCGTGIDWNQGANYTRGTFSASIGINGLYVANTGTVINAVGPKFLCLAKFAGGLGNTNGIVTSFGARVGVRTDWNPTCSGADITVDGITSTLAAMRAATPKAAANSTFGSVVYESVYT